MDTVQTYYFGEYRIDVEKDHAVISAKHFEKNQPVNPTFYEMQHMKCVAFGGTSVAVEVFPSHRDLVDGQHQRHLWKVNRDSVPNLFTGHMVK
jgi:hypothetical protein